MKKHLFKLVGLLSAAVIAASPMSALAAENADDHGEVDKYYVYFTENETMDEYLPASMYDPLQNLQPGDTVYFEITIKNNNSKQTLWYMDNEIVRSLEDYDSDKTNGGAYSYKLELLGGSGPVVLYDSDTIGGDDASADTIGLHQAAEGLEAAELQDFGYLVTLNSGESRKVRLTVSLDGETQGNDYQFTMARTRIRFAVDYPQEGKDEERIEHRRQIVRTGDEFDILPYFAVAFFSGSLLLLLCIFRVVDKKKEKKGGA